MYGMAVEPPSGISAPLPLLLSTASVISTSGAVVSCTVIVKDSCALLPAACYLFLLLPKMSGRSSEPQVPRSKLGGPVPFLAFSLLVMKM